MEGVNAAFGFANPLSLLNPESGKEKTAEFSEAYFFDKEFETENVSLISHRVTSEPVFPKSPQSKIDLQSLYKILSFQEKVQLKETLIFLFQFYENWLEEEDNEAYILNSLSLHYGILAHSLNSPSTKTLLIPLAYAYKYAGNNIAYYFFLNRVLRISNNNDPFHSDRDGTLAILKSISSDFAMLVDKVSKEMGELKNYYGELQTGHAFTYTHLLKKNLIFFKNNMDSFLEKKECQNPLLENKIVQVALLRKVSRGKKFSTSGTNATVLSDYYLLSYDGDGFLFSFENWVAKSNTSPVTTALLEKKKPPILYEKDLFTWVEYFSKAHSSSYKNTFCEIIFIFYKLKKPKAHFFRGNNNYYETLAPNTGIDTEEVIHFFINSHSEAWESIDFKKPELNEFKDIEEDILKGTKKVLDIRNIYQSLLPEEKKIAEKTLFFLLDSYEKWLTRFQQEAFFWHCLTSHEGKLAYPLESQVTLELLIPLAHHFENLKNEKIRAFHHFFLLNILNFTKGNASPYNLNKNLKILKELSLDYESLLHQTTKEKKTTLTDADSLSLTVDFAKSFALTLLLRKALRYFKNNLTSFLKIEPKKLLKNEQVPVCLITKPAKASRNSKFYVANLLVDFNDLGLPHSMDLSFRSNSVCKKNPKFLTNEFFNQKEVIYLSEEQLTQLGVFLQGYKHNSPSPPTLFLFYKVDEEFIPFLGSTDSYFEEEAVNSGISTSQVLYFLKNPDAKQWSYEPLMPKPFDSSDSLISEGESIKKRKQPYDSSKPISLDPITPKRLKKEEDERKKNPLKTYQNHLAFFINVFSTLDTFRPCEKNAKTLDNHSPLFQLSSPNHNQRAIESEAFREIKSLAPKGIPNICNSCYINVVLQILIHIPLFKNLILENQTLKPTSLLENEINTGLRKTGITFNKVKVASLLDELQINGFQSLNFSECQTDEDIIFLQSLFNSAKTELSLQETLKSVIKTLSESVSSENSLESLLAEFRFFLFKRVFYPDICIQSLQDAAQVLEKILYLLNVHAHLVKKKFALGSDFPIGIIERQVSNIVQIPLPATSLNLSFQEVFNLNFSRNLLYDKDPIRITSDTEVLYESNQWEEEYSLENPNSKYLVFQLKRYFQASNGEFQKNDSSYPLAEVLNLSKAFKSKEENLYRPIAAILHDDYGTHKPNWGHYTLLIKIEGTWHHMNDQTVTSLSYPDQLLAKSYIVILEKIEY